MKSNLDFILEKDLTLKDFKPIISSNSTGTGMIQFPVEAHWHTSGINSGLEDESKLPRDSVLAPTCD